MRRVTVQELINQLLALPPDKWQLPVETEGCDCYGPFKGICLYSRYTGEEVLLLERLQPHEEQ